MSDSSEFVDCNGDGRCWVPRYLGTTQDGYTVPKECVYHCTPVECIDCKSKHPWWALTLEQKCPECVEHGKKLRAALEARQWEQKNQECSADGRCFQYHTCDCPVENHVPGCPHVACMRFSSGPVIYCKSRKCSWGCVLWKCKDCNSKHPERLLDSGVCSVCPKKAHAAKQQLEQRFADLVRQIRDRTYRGLQFGEFRYELQHFEEATHIVKITALASDAVVERINVDAWLKMLREHYDPSSFGFSGIVTCREFTTYAHHTNTLYDVFYSVGEYNELRKKHEMFQIYPEIVFNPIVKISEARYHSLLKHCSDYEKFGKSFVNALNRH
jgi:hypothetical protein